MRSIDDCHRLAALQGGRCLSTHYVNASTPMEWKCSVVDHPVFIDVDGTEFVLGPDDTWTDSDSSED